MDHAYNDLGRRDSLTRWADLDGTELVAHTDYAFDELGRLIQLIHSRTGTGLAYYGYQWDKAGQITRIDFDQNFFNRERVLDSYDATGQLTGADYYYSPVGDESYDYDDNGNREEANSDTYATGEHNRLLEDGTYRYGYDGEGNRTLRFVDNPTQGTPDVLDQYDTDITVYAWDHRNRLAAVTDYETYADYIADPAEPHQVVEYTYDPFNQLVGRTVTVEGTLTVTEAFVHNVGQIVLHYESDTAGPLGEADLAHRYLWGPNVDELLADEGPGVDGTPGNDDDTAWALTDHQGTVRDVVAYNTQQATFIVIAHMDYDSFGNVVGVPPTAGGLFLYTARLFDAATGLQNNLNRWYDAAVGRWIAVDPIGFAGGDANLYRYCGNGPTNAVDPSGLQIIVDIINHHRSSGQSPAPAQPVPISPRNDHMVPLQDGESVPPNFKPGGPSDVPDKLDGTWKVSIVTSDAHAYIRYENTETGEAHTVGNYEHGYGGRVDEKGRQVVPPVKLPGIQWDQDLMKEKGFKAGVFPSRTVVVKNPVIYKDETPFAYHWYDDNCTTYAKDAWNSYTSEVYLIPGPDLPKTLKGMIEDKNFRETREIITPYFKSIEPF